MPVPPSKSRSVEREPEAPYPKSLLDDLRGEYRELPTRVVAGALERAHAIEASLTANGEVALGRVTLLARDRLDLLRERADSARRPVGRRYSLATPGPYVTGAGPDELPCTYCLQPVPAASFGYLSGIRQLAFATCPTCRRQTTVRMSIWVGTGGPTQPA